MQLDNLTLLSGYQPTFVFSAVAISSYDYLLGFMGFMIWTVALFGGGLGFQHPSGLFNLHQDDNNYEDCLNILRQLAMVDFGYVIRIPMGDALCL